MVQQDSQAFIPLLSTHANDLPSAARAAIRGFLLAFLAGTAIDIVLPAIMKQKFKGLGQKILYDNRSSYSLGTSAGAFAFLYRILFRQLIVLMQQQQLQHKSCGTATTTTTTPRTDSAIDLVGIHESEDVQYSKDTSTNNKNTATKINRQKWIAAMAAAFLASPAFALIPQKSRQLTVALYFVTYAGEVIYAALEHKGLTAWMPSWLGIWILFPISSSQTVHTFVHHGDCFPDAFRKLILGQCSPFIVRPKGFDAVASGGPYPNSNDVLSSVTNYMQSGFNSVPTLAAAMTTTTTTATTTINSGTAALATSQFKIPDSMLPVLKMTEAMGHPMAMCRFFHPTSESCSSSAVALAKYNMKWALKLYSTLAVLTFVLRGGNVFKRGTYLNGFLGGLWILVESQQRQSALTLYYTRFMLEAVWRRLVKAKVVRNIRHGESLLFGLSMSVIMAIYETIPTLQRKSFIESALQKIFED
ncbi:hypothetical protein BG004_006697 [Podila humilis]|nr:hypothetical protein BG004_006697 [Podila humilis]